MPAPDKMLTGEDVVSILNGVHSALCQVYPHHLPVTTYAVVLRQLSYAFFGASNGVAPDADWTDYMTLIVKPENEHLGKTWGEVLLASAAKSGCAGNA